MKPRFGNIKIENKLFSSLEKPKPLMMINVGCLMDIPTGSFYIGKHGETIINGGLGPITGFAGRGNNYKSTIMHYMALSAGQRVKESGLPLLLHTYDTELNTSGNRFSHLATPFPLVNADDANTENSDWTFTHKGAMPGNKWATMMEKELDTKAKSKEYDINIDVFSTKNDKNGLSVKIPSFIEIDSFTEFEGEKSFDKLSGDLDDGATKTYAMEQGAFKTKFMARLPVLSNSSNSYFLLTAHLGDKIDMNAFPYSPGPAKKLQFMKQDDHIKGASSKFYFLTTQLWNLNNARQLVNQSLKEPEFPLDKNESFKNELNIVDMQLWRNKNGPTNSVISVIVSQSRGVLPTLSEFYNIKQNKYGISGNDRTYHLDIYPDVNLSRTTIRTLIDKDPKLRRAINITSELLQLFEFQYTYLRENDLTKENGSVPSPLEIYEKLKLDGYDWNTLLETRGYWTYDQYENEIPFLSSIDILKMYKGQYQPYFMKFPKEKK